MINIQSKGNGVVIEIKGTGEEISGEVIGAVSGVCESLKKGSKFTAAMFIRLLTKELDKEWAEMVKKNPIMSTLIDTACTHIHAASHKEIEDIRSADFDSDEQFKEWFRGGDE